MIGELGKGYKYAIEALNVGRIGIGAQVFFIASGKSPSVRLINRVCSLHRWWGWQKERLSMQWTTPMKEGRLEQRSRTSRCVYVCMSHGIVFCVPYCSLDLVCALSWL